MRSSFSSFRHKLHQVHAGSTPSSLAPLIHLSRNLNRTVVSPAYTQAATVNAMSDGGAATEELVQLRAEVDRERQARLQAEEALQKVTQERQRLQRARDELARNVLVRCPLQ